MARKRRTPPRDIYGRFLPTKSNPKRVSRRKKNPVSYPEFNAFKLTPPKRPRRKLRNAEANPRRARRQKNPVSYPIYPGEYSQAPNPRRYRRRTNEANPRAMARRRPAKGIYKYNPNGPMTLERMLPPAISAVGGFMAPGLVWDIIGAQARISAAGWFKGSQNSEAWGRFTVGALTTAALYFLSRKVDLLKKYQMPIMIGALLRNGYDLADAVLEKTPGTMGARLRRILSLPTGLQLGATAKPTQPGKTVGEVQGSWKWNGTEWIALTTAGGYAQDPLTGDWIGGQEAGLPADQYPASQQPPLVDPGLPPTQQMTGVGATYPLDPGMGEIHVVRKLREQSRKAGIGEVYVDRKLTDVYGRYKGIGATFTEKGLVYLEPGQRFPAKVY